MTCECGTEFCYVCGQEFGNDNTCGCHHIVDEDGWAQRVTDNQADGNEVEDLDTGVDSEDGDEDSIWDQPIQEEEGGRGLDLDATPGGEW